MKIRKGLTPEQTAQLEYVASQMQDTDSKMDMLAMLAGVDPEEWAAVTTDETAQEVTGNEHNV